MFVRLCMFIRLHVYNFKTALKLKYEKLKNSHINILNFNKYLII